MEGGRRETGTHTHTHTHTQAHGHTPACNIAAAIGCASFPTGFGIAIVSASIDESSNASACPSTLAASFINAAM